MARDSQKHDKKPLYRKVNTKARNTHHDYGHSFDRGGKKGGKNGGNKNMTKKDRGLDYTPLYKFLLSKVGKEWDVVFSEAKSRLPKNDYINPINNMVYSSLEVSEFDTIRTDESSYYNTLYIDGNGILQKVNTEINETTLEPSCSCCTHTFNGKVFTKKYIKETKC